MSRVRCGQGKYGIGPALLPLALLLCSLAGLGCHRSLFISVLRAPPTDEGKLGVPMRGTLTTIEGTSDSAAYQYAFIYRLPSAGTFTATLESTPANIDVDVYAFAMAEPGSKPIGETTGLAEKRLVLHLDAPCELYILLHEAWHGRDTVWGQADFQLTATLTAP